MLCVQLSGQAVSGGGEVPGKPVVPATLLPDPGVPEAPPVVPHPNVLPQAPVVHDCEEPQPMVEPQTPVVHHPFVDPHPPVESDEPSVLLPVPAENTVTVQSSMSSRVALSSLASLCSKQRVKGSLLTQVASEDSHHEEQNQELHGTRSSYQARAKTACVTAALRAYRCPYRA